MPFLLSVKLLYTVISTPGYQPSYIRSPRLDLRRVSPQSASIMGPGYCPTSSDQRRISKSDEESRRCPLICTVRIYIPFITIPRVLYPSGDIAC